MKARIIMRLNTSVILDKHILFTGMILPSSARMHSNLSRLTQLMHINHLLRINKHFAKHFGRGKKEKRLSLSHTYNHKNYISSSRNL